MKEYMFLVEWGESTQGEYGIFLAKSMRDLYLTLDSIGQCHDAKVKQINNGGDHSSFYIDLNDPMDVNTDTYFNGSIIEAKNFPEGSEERKILEGQEEGEIDEYNWHEGGKENGWYSIKELTEAMPNYARGYKGDRVCDTSFEDLTEREGLQGDMDNVFQMFLLECEFENEYMKYCEPEHLEVIDF